MTPNMTVENSTGQEPATETNSYTHRPRNLLGLAALTLTIAAAAAFLAPETAFAAGTETASSLIHKYPIAAGLAVGLVNGLVYAAARAYFCKPSSRSDETYYYSTCQRFEVIANTSIPAGSIVGLVVGGLWWLMQ